MAVVPVGIRDGKRVRRKVRARNEQDAKDKLARLQRAYRPGTSTATLGAYLAEWLDGWQEIRKSTRTSYAGHIRLHIDPLLGGIPLAQLSPSDIRRLVLDLQRKGLAAATVGRVITTLRIALNAALGERLIHDNPASHVKLPRVEREPVTPLTVEDADAIIEAVRGHWVEPIVRLLLGSGLRLGEAIGLDQGDLLLDGGYVRVRISKTRVRAVPISDDAVDALRKVLAAAPRRGPKEPAFFGPRESRHRLRGDSVTQVLPKLMERAGLGHLTPHSLRHGVATLMLTAGVPMRVISEQLGHRNPALTARIYAHVVPDAQRAALAVLERRQAQ